MQKDAHSAVDCRTGTLTMVYFSLIVFFFIFFGVYCFIRTRSTRLLPEPRRWEIQEGLSVGLALAIAVFMCIFISVSLQTLGNSLHIVTN